LGLWGKIIPPFWGHTGADSRTAEHYRHIWQINFITACLVTLTPLAIVAVYDIYTLGEADRGLLWLILAMVPFILIAVYLGTMHQVNRLYQLDLYRNEIQKEIVYSHRLASVGRLAAGVAHEINNPMAVIREKAGLVQDLMERDGAKCDIQYLHRLLDDIQDNCQRASNITHRLLGFGRHLELEIKELNPVKVIQDVVSLFRQKSHYRGISVVIDCSDEELSINCDQGALEQLALTFLDNAFEAVPDGGSIQIEVAGTKGRQLRLAFQDNGPGISRDDLQHLFEPFFSASKGDHAGLGLSIAYGIVRKLGGEIHVESEMGGGATFTVILPQDQPGELDRAAEEEIGRYALRAKGPSELAG
jgi:two-component system NtrC family sensor kinase